MATLELELRCDPTNKRIVAIVRNAGCQPLTIGDLRLNNLIFSSLENADHHASPWISTQILNAGERRSLAPLESFVYEYDYLSEYDFPASGRYRVWLIYDSLGFQERFRDADGLHAGLDTLDEFRCVSEKSVVTILDADYESNQTRLRCRRHEFLGDLSKS